jgi:hypothetical protein
MRVNIIVGLILFGATALLAQESLRIRLEENEQSFWTKAQLGDLEWRFWYASQGPLLGAKQRGAVGLAYGDFYLGPLAFRSPAGLPGKWAAGGGSSSIDELWRTSRQWKDHSSSTFGVLYHGDWGGWAWADAKDKSGLIDLGYLSPAKIGWQWGLGLKVAWEEDPGTEENCLQEMDWDQVLWGTLAYESTSALVYLSYHQLLALPELLGLQFPPWGMVSLGGDWEPWEKHVSLTALLWWATPSLLYSPLEEYAELGLRGFSIRIGSPLPSTSQQLGIASWDLCAYPWRSIPGKGLFPAKHWHSSKPSWGGSLRAYISPDKSLWGTIGTGKFTGGWRLIMSPGLLPASGKDRISIIPKNLFRVGILELLGKAKGGVWPWL